MAILGKKQMSERRHPIELYYSRSFREVGKVISRWKPKSQIVASISGGTS